MTFDVFFSICQNDVHGVKPSERQMLLNFFDQVKLADELGYTTAWVAETHLSTEIQKRHSNPVIPHFEGEIGLNTDILQVAHKVFSMTKRIHVGSAIRNIICNGGPMAHAEAIRTFLSLHGLDDAEDRLLNIGFAQGRFEFANRPYGFRPRSAVEQAAWPALRGMVFREATEIFLRFLRGDVFSSKDVSPKVLKREWFRSDEDWQKVLDARGDATDEIPLEPWWQFEENGVIPLDAPLDLLRLTIGSHDPHAQKLANQFMPVGVFNLSITPFSTIERTHEMMQATYHPDGGPWSRHYMPRTVLVFIEDDQSVGAEAARKRAFERARDALEIYWKALQGTLDPERVEQAVENALVGTPEDVIQQAKERFHPDDRLMLWFDFNNHDNDAVKHSMRLFMEKIAPHVS